MRMISWSRLRLRTESHQSENRMPTPIFSALLTEAMRSFPMKMGDGEFSRHHVGLNLYHLLGYEDGASIRYTAAFFFKAAFYSLG